VMPAMAVGSMGLGSWGQADQAKGEERSCS